MSIKIVIFGSSLEKEEINKETAHLNQYKWQSLNHITS